MWTKWKLQWFARFCAAAVAVAVAWHALQTMDMLEHITCTVNLFLKRCSVQWPCQSIRHWIFGKIDLSGSKNSPNKNSWKIEYFLCFCFDQGGFYLSLYCHWITASRYYLSHYRMISDVVSFRQCFWWESNCFILLLHLFSISSFPRNLMCLKMSKCARVSRPY